MVLVEQMHLVAETWLLPEDAACKYPLVALHYVESSEVALMVMVLFAVGHQQWQLNTSNSFEVAPGIGHIQQVCQDFDCPKLPISISCSRQGTSGFARW